MISERLANALDAWRDAAKDRALNPRPVEEYPEDAEMERAAMEFNARVEKERSK